MTTNNNNTPSLSDVALLVYLSISVPPESVERKDLSSELRTRAGVKDPRAVKATVRIIPSGVLTPDNDPWTIGRRARQEHYRLTLPYGAGRGFALLPAALLIEYSRTLADYRTRFEQAAEYVVSHWDDIRDRARVSLAGVWREIDYPSADRIRDRFGLTFDRQPLSSGGSALSTLTDPLAVRLREHWESQARANVAEAQADALDRAADALSHFAAKVGLYDPYATDRRKCSFRDGTVAAVSDIADLLPAFNVLSDARTRGVVGDLVALVKMHRGGDDSSTWADRIRNVYTSDARQALSERAGRIALSAAQAAGHLRGPAPTSTTAPAPDVFCADADALSAAAISAL